MIVGAVAVTRRRYAAATIVARRAVAGAHTDSTIMASVQPVNGADTEHLPEGQRARVQLKVYTTTDLRGADAGQQADDLVIDGEVLEVVEVQQHTAVLPHYRALLMRRADR
jgi:hypothetical protein